MVIYPFAIMPEQMPIEALMCLGKQKALINELRFFQVNSKTIDVCFGGERLATWTGKEWLGPIRKSG